MSKKSLAELLQVDLGLISRN